MNVNVTKQISTFLIILLLSISHSAFAFAPSESDVVDRYVQSQMQKLKIPGFSLAVIKNGKLIKAKGYGLASVEFNVPAKPETIYQSGSVGKQFTATLIMMLVEKGQIHLNDKISKYLPNTPPSWKNITIRNLLTHTSGIKDYTKGEINYRLDYTEPQLLKIIESLPLNFQPGEKWSYSNSGYVLLGFIIKKVTGKFYGDLLHEYIFTPLGMNTARIINEADIIPNRAAGYRLLKGELKNQEYVSPSLNTTADGSLYITVYDMTKWDAALYTDKLLNKSDLELMWTPTKLNNGNLANSPEGYYGFGWFINFVNGHRVIEHPGAWQGFTAFIARYVNDKLTIIVLTNIAETEVDPNRLARIVHHIAGLYNANLMPREGKRVPTLT